MKTESGGIYNHIKLSEILTVGLYHIYMESGIHMRPYPPKPIPWLMRAFSRVNGEKSGIMKAPA